MQGDHQFKASQPAWTTYLVSFRASHVSNKCKTVKKKCFHLVVWDHHGEQCRPWLGNHRYRKRSRKTKAKGTTAAINQPIRRKLPSTLAISARVQPVPSSALLFLDQQIIKESNVLPSFLKIPPKLSLPWTVLITWEQSSLRLDPICPEFWRTWGFLPPAVFNHLLFTQPLGFLVSQVHPLIFLWPS